MNLLITGGAGFIGSNAAQYFLNKGDKVTILDNFSRKGSIKNAEWLSNSYKKNLKVVQADVRYDNISLFKEIEKSDVVVHLAGQVAVTTSVKFPKEDFDINALGTLNVLEAIRNSKSKPLIIYSSTNKVYGAMESVKIKELKTRYTYKDLPFGISEKFQLDFHSPYGCSKGAADQYVNDYSRIYGLETVVFRQSCIYGPRQFGVEDQGWLAWFLISGVNNMPVTIYGDGKQVRDVLYIEDLIKAYDAVITKRGKKKGRVFNIGGGRDNSLSVWHEFSLLISRNLKRDLTVNFSDWRPGDQKVYISDIRKIKKDLGWEPKITPDDGVKALSEWIIKNKNLFL